MLFAGRGRVGGGSRSWPEEWLRSPTTLVMRAGSMNKITFVMHGSPELATLVSPGGSSLFTILPSKLLAHSYF